MATASSQDRIGIEIRARREALGMTREGLADRAGVAFKTIERIELAQVTPRRATLAAIERVLDAGFERAGEKAAA